LQPSLLAKVMGDAQFTILFATDHHVEMVYATENDPCAYFLTVTPKDGATIHSGMTVGSLEAVSQSIYLSARDRGLPAGQDKVGEGELLGPNGLIHVPEVDNVVYFDFRRKA